MKVAIAAVQCANLCQGNVLPTAGTIRSQDHCKEKNNLPLLFPERERTLCRKLFICQYYRLQCNNISILSFVYDVCEAPSVTKAYDN